MINMILCSDQVPRHVPLYVQQWPPPGHRGDSGDGGAGPHQHLGHQVRAHTLETLVPTYNLLQELDSGGLSPDSPRPGPEPGHFPG